MSDVELKSFHVRGMPVSVIRQIKMEAARLGVNVAEVIRRAVAALKGGRNA